jgi:hypothetical protein
MPRLFAKATLPNALVQPWLQHMRDFDAKNPGCHFEVAVDLPTVSLHEAIEKLQVDPKLTFTEIFERQK